MNEQQSPQKSRAALVWQHLAAMFGADALKRKFGLQPPEEWSAALSYLADAQLQHGLDALLRSGSEHMPSLPQFLASCRSAREFSADQAQLALPGAEKPDAWESAANSHLLGYVAKCGAVRRYFDRRETLILCQFKRSWAEDCRVDAIEGGMPVPEQKRRWREAMLGAEQAMAA